MWEEWTIPASKGLSRSHPRETHQPRGAYDRTGEEIAEANRPSNESSRSLPPERSRLPPPKRSISTPLTRRAPLIAKPCKKHILCGRPCLRSFSPSQPACKCRGPCFRVPIASCAGACF